MITDPTFFQNELLGYVTKKVRDKSLAEDLVHDVFLKVQAKSAQIKDKQKAIAWIYRIAQNTIADHFRDRSKILGIRDFGWEDDSQNFNPCAESCLAAKLATLPGKYREALEWSEVQGLSQVDLAKRLAISYSGAKSRVQRARQMLKEQMDKEYLIKMDNYGNVIQCKSLLVPCNCS